MTALSLSLFAFCENSEYELLELLIRCLKRIEG